MTSDLKIRTSTCQTRAIADPSSHQARLIVKRSDFCLSPVFTACLESEPTFLLLEFVCDECLLLPGVEPASNTCMCFNKVPS